MINYKTNEEIELIRQSSLIVSKTLAEVAKFIRPGVSTLRLDTIAEEFMVASGGKPAFKGYNGFPNVLCISVNEEVVHGIPSVRELEEGDIVSVDCGILKDGFFGDSAYTFAVGSVSEEVKKLLKVTKESLYKGIEQAIVGNRLGDISFAIQEHCESNGYSVVREMVGHGIGKNLHEEPEVPNYGKRGKGFLLKEGLVIAIEPMINMGKKDVRTAKDKWTIFAIDKLPSAHFEHTLAIRKNKTDILSGFELIEQAELKNIELYSEKV